MASPPLKTAISDTYPNPSNATARAGFGQLHDYVTSLPFGHCRLVKSGANIVLQRFKGLWLTINDKDYAIPSAGVSLAATGLTVGTLYYIYAYMSGVTMTLEASTTGHSTDTATGVEIKTGDATRTLVGMARPITGPAWADTAAQRFVISWFNRLPITLGNGFTANRGYTSSTTGEVNAEIRNEFLNWAGSGIQASINGQGGHSTTNSIMDTWIGVDGAQVDALSSFQQPTGGNRCSFNVNYAGTTTEGYHYTTLMADNPSGAGSLSYNGAAAGAVRCTLYTTIQG
ncbi:hypothetical protein [Variovorax saccharolyticus]|uniref:hypothetical protein n=1 Tax=Variovorax saccharolyticus TaxID=3053516 RepID=UPI002575832D|nr:hypothetical protein [Variovorax sp. J31P216]MDM0024068.1 hypothetical protein [Variovorax sp. J31P216]